MIIYKVLQTPLSCSRVRYVPFLPHCHTVHVETETFMGKEILQKYTIFEVKRHLAEMKKQYGKERVTEMLGEDHIAVVDQ